MVVHQTVKPAVPDSNPASLQPAGTCHSLLESQQGWHHNCRLASEGRQWQKIQKYNKNNKKKKEKKYYSKISTPYNIRLTHVGVEGVTCTVIPSRLSK